MGLKPHSYREGEFFVNFFNNAARNILVVGGHTPDKKNGLLGQHKTTAKVAAACEMSTRRGAKAWYETQCLEAGKGVKILNQDQDWPETRLRQ